MRKILAVSGGIDSVVMLHLFAARADLASGDELIVAHFNHGIRPNSQDDCDFIEKLAKKYNLKFISKTAHLGEKCSEEKARQERYAFLKSLLKNPEDKIFTAHHQDDLLETAIINLLRGTGWRGLAPLRAEQIERPLLDWTKKDIYRYATENNLSFRQDQSNNEEKYLRNRVRRELQNLSKTQDSLKNHSAELQKMVKIILRQREIADEVDNILQTAFAGKKKFKRELLKHLEKTIAREILNFILKTRNIRQTRPQLERALGAIKTFEPGKRFSLNKDSFLKINKFYFGIERS